MDGRATFTIVASRTTMNCARQIRTRTTHGLVAVRRTAALLPFTGRNFSIGAKKVALDCVECKNASNAGNVLGSPHAATGHGTARAEEAGDASGANPRGARALRRARLRRDDARGDRRDGR